MEKLKAIIDAHRFFVKATPKYLNGDENIKWKEKELYFPTRGLEYYWYIPLTIKQKLYYPIAYTKFMYWSIRDVFNDLITLSKGQ